MKFSRIKIFLTMFIANFFFLEMAEMIRGSMQGYAIILVGNDVMLSQVLPFIFLTGSAVGFLLIIISRRYEFDAIYRQVIFYGVLAFSLGVLIVPYLDYMEFHNRSLQLLTFILIPFSEYYVSRLLNIGLITYVLGFALGAWSLYTLLKSSGNARKPKEKNGLTTQSEIYTN